MTKRTSLRALAAIALACCVPATALAALSGAGTVASPFDSGQWDSFQLVATPLSPTEGPADEYFGRFKFSNLEVRNTVKDLRIEGVSSLALDTQRFHIEEARQALVGWMEKYPRDPWIPGTMLGFADQVHARSQPDLDMTALFFYQYLSTHYAGHYFGKTADQRIAGFEPNAGYDISSAFDPYFPLSYVMDGIYPGTGK